MSEAWEKAYRALWRREEKFLRRYEKPGWNALERKIEERVPEKLIETLHTAFAKAFELLFEKGTGVIAGAGRLEERQCAYRVNAYAADLREDRRSLRAFSREAARAGRGNLLLSGAVGVSMGLFGGEGLRRKNRELDVFAQTGAWPEAADLNSQMKATARRLSEVLQRLLRQRQKLLGIK